MCVNWWNCVEGDVVRACSPVKMKDGCETKDGVTICFCNTDLCNGEYTSQSCMVTGQVTGYSMSIISLMRLQFSISLHSPPI